MSKGELPVLKQAPLNYDCAKCPGYCCSYDYIIVNRRDVARLGRRFGMTPEEAEAKFTKLITGYGRVLRHHKDHVFKSVCQFLDTTKRRCTVYEHRPGVCRGYPESKRCGYYDFLRWERQHQDDKTFIPLRQES